MTIEFEDILDTIDAAVFSGDTFDDPKNLEILKEYVGRWNRQLNLLEGFDKNENS